MNFEADEIAQLRTQILEFILQQLRESAARGELQEASEALARPIAAQVEASVHRALAIPSKVAEARLSDGEVRRVAMAVAAQLQSSGSVGGHTAVEPATALTGRSTKPTFDFRDAPAIALQTELTSGTSNPIQPNTSQSPSLQLAPIKLLGALALGIVIGAAGVKLLAGQPDTSVGSESARVIQQTMPSADSDADLQQIEGSDSIQLAPTARAKGSVNRPTKDNNPLAQ